MSLVRTVSIVRSFDKSEARSARHVSTANQFYCKHQSNVTFRTLYSKIHTWGPCWYTGAECRVESIKYGCHNPLPASTHSYGKRKGFRFSQNDFIFSHVKLKWNNILNYLDIDNWMDIFILNCHMLHICD